VDTGENSPAQAVQGSAHSAHTDATQVDADLASELIASGVTTQPVEIVMAVLAASRDGVSINATAKASGINYRTAQRIVEAAAAYRQRQLAAVGWLESGVHIKAVADLLGHSSIAITGDVYGHVSDIAARSAVDGWSGALGL
jgi:integrase